MLSKKITSATTQTKTPLTGVREEDCALSKGMHPVDLTIAAIPPQPAYSPPANATPGMRPPGVVPRPSDDTQTPEFQRSLKFRTSREAGLDDILSPENYLLSPELAALAALSPDATRETAGGQDKFVLASQTPIAPDPSVPDLFMQSLSSPHQSVPDPSAGTQRLTPHDASTQITSPTRRFGRS